MANRGVHCRFTRVPDPSITGILRHNSRFDSFHDKAGISYHSGHPWCPYPLASGPAKRAREALALLPAHATPGECYNDMMNILKNLEFDIQSRAGQK
jgi:hypothetical protein